MRGMSTFTICAVFALVAFTTPGRAVSQIIGDCGDPFHNAFGPIDYRTATPEQKLLVEGTHFTTPVEALKSGVSGSIGAEIDYTLRVFPNHPRALMSMVRLGQRDKTNKPKGANYSVECYLERAMLYRPDDVNVRLVRGIYFAMQRNYNSAIADFSSVIDQNPGNANAHYNLGLAYFETKQYEKATEEAKRAISLDFPLDGLKNKLTAAGKWRD